MPLTLSLRRPIPDDFHCWWWFFSPVSRSASSTLSSSFLWPPKFSTPFSSFSADCASSIPYSRSYLPSTTTTISTPELRRWFAIWYPLSPSAISTRRPLCRLLSITRSTPAIRFTSTTSLTIRTSSMIPMGTKTSRTTPSTKSSTPFLKRTSMPNLCSISSLRYKSITTLFPSRKRWWRSATTFVRTLLIAIIPSSSMRLLRSSRISLTMPISTTPGMTPSWSHSMFPSTAWRGTLTLTETRRLSSLRVTLYSAVLSCLSSSRFRLVRFALLLLLFFVHLILIKCPLHLPSCLEHCFVLEIRKHRSWKRTSKRTSFLDGCIFILFLSWRWTLCSWLSSCLFSASPTDTWSLLERSAIQMQESCILRKSLFRMISYRYERYHPDDSETVDVKVYKCNGPDVQEVCIRFPQLFLILF